jgi:hypothetical protein
VKEKSHNFRHCEAPECSRGTVAIPDSRKRVKSFNAEGRGGGPLVGRSSRRGPQRKPKSGGNSSSRKSVKSLFTAGSAGLHSVKSWILDPGSLIT